MKSNEYNLPETHRFAWDGFSFHVPRDWNLSDYSFHGKTASVRMEDDNAMRLEMEWIRPRKAVKDSVLRDRCARIGKSMAEEGAESSAIDGLPAGWTAVVYSMQDGKYLLTAYRLDPKSSFFCLFKLYFAAASRREPPRMIRKIASTFMLHEDGPVPWEFYDVSIRVARGFRLVNTSFLAGRKLMVFEWRLRRLYVWFFSLADTILKRKPMEEWCADYLNDFKGIQGPKFLPGRNGAIFTRFSFRYPLGHFEEIFRWCFRYHAQSRHVPERNHVVLCVFNYRNHRDLAMIADMDKKGAAA